MKKTSARGSDVGTELQAAGGAATDSSDTKTTERLWLMCPAASLFLD